MNYTVKIKYETEITTVVEANNEGEALDKARDYAEVADSGEFEIGEETESYIVRN